MPACKYIYQLRHLRLLSVVAAFFLLLPLYGFADNIRGVASAYTTDCPLQKTATINYKYKTVKETAIAAAEYAEKLEKQMESFIKDSGGKDAMILKSNHNINKLLDGRLGGGKNFWQASGNGSFKVPADKAKSILLKLSEKDVEVGMRITSNRQSRCKK